MVKKSRNKIKMREGGKRTEAHHFPAGVNFIFPWYTVAEAG